MINLIRNELYKIFHKKSIYIILLITLLFSIFVNFIYNSSFASVNYLDESYELELYYSKTLEKEGNTDSEDYLYSKIYIKTYEFAKSFGKDSWQRYILSTDETYSTRLNNIMDTIVKYELKKLNNKELYEQALKEKDTLEKELKEISWKEFAKKDIENTKELLASETIEEAKYMYQAKIDTLNLRLNNNIKYGFNNFNDYLEIYQNNRSIVLSYEEVEESLLKEEEKKNRDSAIQDMELVKYRIENKIEEPSYKTAYSVINNFYIEFNIIIIVIIVLVSGSIVSDEFSKGTIKLLLVKPYTRTKILLAKYVTTLLMVLFAIIVTFTFNFIISGIFFGYDSLSIPFIVYDLGANTIKEMHILKYVLLMTIAILPQLIILSTLAFSLSAITTSTSLTNTLTMVVAFGGNIINAIAQTLEITLIKLSVTLHWDFSCYLFGGASPYKGVSLPLSITVCIIYLILMLVITNIVFNKRNIKNI